MLMHMCMRDAGPGHCQSSDQVTSPYGNKYKELTPIGETHVRETRHQGPEHSAPLTSVKRTHCQTTVQSIRGPRAPAKQGRVRCQPRARTNACPGWTGHCIAVTRETAP